MIQIKPRILGGDRELGFEVLTNEKGERFHSLEIKDLFRANFLSEKLGKDIEPLYTNRIYLRNGGQIYLDCGHPEICIPENTSPFDTVKNEEALILELRQIIGNEHGAKIFKDCEDYDGNTYGSHDNLSTTIHPFKRQQLILPCIIEKLWSGTGGLSKQGVFRISQREPHITKCEDEWTRKDRGIINIRPESLAGENLFRFHHISNDPRMCQGGNILTYGVLDIFLTLAENKLLPQFGDYDPKLRIPHLQNLEQGVLDLRRISSQTHSWELPDMPSEWRSPIAIAKKYHEIASVELKGMKKDTDFVLEKWAEILSALENRKSNQDDMKQDALVGDIDWATKLWALRKFADRNQYDFSHPKIQDNFLDFHKLDGESIFYAMQESELVRVYISQQDIEKARTNPPTDTRAYFRGKAKQIFDKFNLENKLTFRGDWTETLVFTKSRFGKEEEIFRLATYDPFNTYSHELDRFEKEIKRFATNLASLSSQHTTS